MSIAEDTLPQEPYVVEDRARHLFRVNRRAFVDTQVLAREQRAVFDRCWLYVGHDSEIAAPGDFLTRDVGGRELIFVRDKAGEVRALFNTCPHRGAMVCREPHGNAGGFRCFYHSWAFDLAGKLINRAEADRYRADPASGVHDLSPVPRLAEYRGFWFVNYDPGAIDLERYLAGAREYLDLTADQSEAGMEIVGGIQEYGFEANWKLLAENSFDGYHANSTHASYFDYLMARGGQLEGGLGAAGLGLKDLGNGHAVIEYLAPWGRPIAKPVPAWGEAGRRDCERVLARLTERFGAARAERIATHNFNMVIFPNLVINNIMAITVRTFFPDSPERQRVKAWALAPRDETEAMRARRLENFLEFLGPGGFATPDDCEALRLCQKGYRNLSFAAWNDISKGMGSDNLKMSDEEQMRIFWREWNRRMSDPAL